MPLVQNNVSLAELASFFHRGKLRSQEDLMPYPKEPILPVRFSLKMMCSDGKKQNLRSVRFVCGVQIDCIVLLSGPCVHAAVVPVVAVDVPTAALSVKPLSTSSLA